MLRYSSSGYSVSRISPARTVAFDVITAVRVDDAYSNLVLPAAIDRAKLSSRDAGLATELTYGTLRRQGSLDSVINVCASRTDTMDPTVRDILRLGVYQLLFMRIPSHAAVSETVELTRNIVGIGASKFVNAVLRKISRQSWQQWCEQLCDGAKPLDALAITYAYPTWVIRSLMDAYNCDEETIRPVLEAGNIPAPVSLVARPGQCTLEELLASEHLQPGRWSPLAAVIERPEQGQSWSTRPGDIALIRQQRAGVQDEGSQLVALALANVAIDGDESLWLDMCAGPGGKAAILAGMATLRNADFLAIEPVPARATLVRSALEHAPGHHEILTADARTYETGHLCDRILIDAPCSGLGALRRRPEARWRKQPSDIPVLTKLQTELLNHAATLVRVGGVIGYATCSPHIAETDAIVQAFLSTHENFTAVDLAPVLPQLQLSPGTTHMRLRTDLHQTDGMYLSILKRMR